MPMNETFEEEFNEAMWNEERVVLENLAITAVLDISDFMGCSSFSFLHDGKRISIKIEQ